MTLPRWTPARKAEICRQIMVGETSAASAIERHQLSEDELADWLFRYRRHGIAGLSITKLQQFKRRA